MGRLGLSRPRTDGSAHYLCHSDFSSWSRASDSYKRKKGPIQEMSGSQQSVFQSRICSLWGLCLTTSPPQGLLTDLANVKLASWLRSLWESRPMSIVLRRSPVRSACVPSTTGHLKAALPVLRHDPRASLQSVPAQVDSVQAEVRRLTTLLPILHLSRPLGAKVSL